MVDLAHVDVFVEAVRMAGLVVARGSSRAAGFYLAGYEVQVPVEPVYRLISDAKPAAAIDPGPPFSEIGYEVWQVTVVQLSGQFAESVHGGRMVRMVVDPEVCVRVCAGFVAGSRATQHYSFDAFKLSETLRYVRR